jgi:3-phosphoshikimate 1-carboxyvinyltransferase
VDLRDAPDLLPLVAVLAVRARGTTRIRGVPHARIKESDRIRATVRGLVALGGAAEEMPDGVVVTGGGPRPGAVRVRADHRLAFAFGVLGLVVPGVVLQGAESVAKSHPAFLADLARAASGAPASDG